jgi:hypothetical protein
VTSGTLSIDPPDGAAVRLSSVIAVTVTVTLPAGETLPQGAQATLQVHDGGELTSNPQQPFVPDSVNSQKANAVFYVAVDPDAQRVNLDAGTDDTIQTTPPTLNARYQPVLPAATVLYADPNPLWLPAAPDDNQLPTNTACTVHYSAVVTDDKDEPIPNYIIEWDQVWDADAYENMRPFPSLTATAPLVPDFSDFHKNGVVRTKTDEKGVSDLYMVTTTQFVFVALKGTGRIDEPTPMQPVIVFGELVDTKLPAPQPVLFVGGDGIADLDSTPGPSVSVNIQTTPANRWPIIRPIEVLLFVNGLVGVKALEFGNAFQRSPNLVFDVAKMHFYTDHGPHANEINDVYYVSAVQGGSVGRSPAWQHRAKGDNDGNQPDPDVTRVLDAPQVLYADPWINVKTVQNGLFLAIPIHDYPNIWTPEQYDVITATIYLDAWDSQTGSVKNNNSFSQSYTLPDPSQLGPGVDLLFPYDEVIGYDSSTDDPPRSGALYAKYYVVKYYDVSRENPIYSYIYGNSLDTAAPGYISPP